MPAIWERLPDEPKTAFRAFEEYLYSDVRQLPLADTLPGRKKWPRLFMWATRAEAWDDDIGKRRKESTTVAIQERSVQVVLNAENILQTEMDQAFFDPADVFTWDGRGTVKMKPTEQIPKNVRRVMFSKVRLTPNRDGELVPIFEIASQQARQKSISLLGEYKSLWRKKENEASEDFRQDFATFLKAVNSGQLNDLMKWAENYLDVPTDVQVREVSDAEIVEDYPEDETNLIPRK